MIRSFLLIFLALLVDVAAEQLNAPGELNCPALQVGAHVITTHSCTSAPSVAETICSFKCPEGYTLSGPSHKTCQLDGSWTNQAVPVECDDVNECDLANGFCSHICENTQGSFQCKCPHPLFLDPENKRKCKAKGVQLDCKPNHMEIVLPKNLIHNLEHEHLSLSDPDCRAHGNATHYSLSTDITQCGTKSHVYKNFIVYTNRVMESPNEDSDVVTHVGVKEILVPFSCYYNDLEIVSAVGYKPVAQKIHVYVQGRGEYALSLDIFKDGTYGEQRSVALASSSAKYTQADFPIVKHLRERIYVQASLDTRETDLKIFASNCCSTPMQDHEATIKFRHALIVEGCPRDPSVRFHASSDPRKVRFSFDLFKFLGGHDYVFIHCRVHVCDVNDPDSRCAKGCLPGNGPAKRNQDKHGNRAQPSDKRAKTVAQSNERHIKKVVAPASEKTTKLHAASKKIAEKPASRPNAKRAKAPLASEKKAQDHPKAPARNAVKTAVHRIMKRTAEGSRKRGVLGSADLSIKGPIVLDIDGRKDFKRDPRPKKVFAQSQGSAIERDVNDKNKRSSVAPSSTNILLVAMTVASIMALVGVMYLGRKAIKVVNNPYNYEPLSVN